MCRSVKISMIRRETGMVENRSGAERHVSRRDIFELALGYGLILAVIWTPNPAQRILYWIAIAVLIVVTVLRREKPAELGLTGNGFLRSLWVVGLAALLAAISIAVAWHAHTLHRHLGRVSLNFHFTGYIIWALVQQFLLQDYFLGRFLSLFSNRWVAVAGATALFTIAHIPNPILVVLTLVWGFIACALFLRYRNLYTLGIAHAILGIGVAITVPSHIQRHMRVGIGYLHYHPKARSLHPHQP
jgi:membrane protease YdiL (CAAX protease family)